MVPCLLATGNMFEIVPYTASGNVQEMSIVGNVHLMNWECDQLDTNFLGFLNLANLGFLPILIDDLVIAIYILFD